MNPRTVIRSTVWLFAPVALLICLPAWVRTQSATFIPRTDPATAGHSTITGRAVYDDTGRPIRRVAVMLFSKDNQADVLTSITNANGEFSFKNVTAGDYRVVVGFPGHRNQSSGYILDRGTGAEVSVDGSSTADVKLRAERGASITGKVTYPDGEPAVGAQVNAFMKVGKEWVRAPYVGSGVETDDRGMFRIYPLKAGEYIVSVIEQSLTIEERDKGTLQTVENKSVTPYYYLDASSIKNARVIQVEPGRETNNIDVTLAERATYQVAGTITVSGRPFAEASLRLNAQEEVVGRSLSWPYGISTRADQDGHWSFKDVPDGTYNIVLDPVRFNEEDGPKRILAHTEKVTIAGADVLNLTIALSEGGRISGTVIVEGKKPSPKSLNIFAERVESNRPRGYISNSSVTLDAKGAFLLEGVAPGENILSVYSEEQYFVKSLTCNNRDLMRQTLKVQEGGEVKGVVVVLSQDVGTLSGHIVSVQHKTMPKTLFVLLPVDEAKWNRREALLGGGSDAAGGFSVSGAPGEYLMVVVPGRARTIKSLDDLKKLAPQATRVTLKTTPQSEVEIVAPAESTPPN